MEEEEDLMGVQEDVREEAESQARKSTREPKRKEG